MKSNSFRRLGICVVSGLIVGCVISIKENVARAQSFSLVTSGDVATTNKIAWSTSWIDYDDDGDPDLFITDSDGNILYRNEGGWAFTRADIGLLGETNGIGNTWGDYDEDGDLDVFISGDPSGLYRQDASDRTFTRVEVGDVAPIDVRGWGAAWGDYDNDGYLDLIVAHPAGFIGPSTTNHLFRNDGLPDFRLTRVEGTPVTAEKAPFTIPTWSDFDLDGDIDLSFGTGPAGSLGRDRIYQNSVRQPGSSSFSPMESDDPIATEERDGQVINWIDADNDGDMDAYVTNYVGNSVGGTGYPNSMHLLRGSLYAKVTEGRHVTDADVSLANTWGDVDNDGDLDVFVANARTSAETPGFNRLYVNDGAGGFTAVDAGVSSLETSNSGAAFADVDGDGDLDLYVTNISRSSPNPGLLYRNDLSSGNHWIKVKTIGDASNRAGIGARVRVLGTIGGKTYWQIREVSAQNTFGGQNDLTVHIGLGDATVADSLVVRWPSGGVDGMGPVAADQLIVVTETRMTTSTEPETKPEPETPEVALTIGAPYPNPFAVETEVHFSLAGAGRASVKAYDLLGRCVATLSDAIRGPGAHSVRWTGLDEDGRRLPGGMYFIVVEADGYRRARLVALSR